MAAFYAKYIRRRRWRLIGILVCLLPGPVSGFAQQTAPSTVNPAYLQRNLDRPPEVEPPPRITLPEMEEGEAPADADAVTFVFQGLTIEGASAISETRLRAAWPHKAGETATVGDIFRFANAITKTYRTSGYGLSYALVPAQDVENGAFTILVIEGFIERVVAQGVKRKRIRARIERIADKLTARRPVRMADLERALLLINDLPGVAVSGVLSPGERRGGAVLTLEARSNALFASVGYNSFMPETLGRHIVDASVGISGLVTGSDHLRLRAQRTPASNAYWSVWGDISTAVGSSGLRAGTSGFYSKSDPEDEFLDALEYQGTSSYGRAYVEHPVMRSRRRNLYVGAAFEVNNTSSDLLAQTFFDDRLRSASVWAAYEFVDFTQAATTIKATVNQGFDILSARGDSRANGQLDYTAMQLDMQRSQPIAQLAGGSFSLRVDGFGQVALRDRALFSAAECSYGGRRFGRAFDAGVITGDSCATGSAELQWTTPLDLPRVPAPAAIGFYAFVDGGLSWQNGALQPGEEERLSAASAGLGASLQFSELASGLVEVSRQVSFSAGEVIASPRITGALVIRF